MNFVNEYLPEAFLCSKSLTSINTTPNTFLPNCIAIIVTVKYILQVIKLVYC